MIHPVIKRSMIKARTARQVTLDFSPTIKETPVALTQSQLIQ